MKKFVLNLDLQNDKDEQRRAFKTISTLSGIDEITIDLKGKKLTMIGTVDPVSVVSKLRKRNWPTHIISVGVWPEKKEEPKKEAPKKEEEAKKEEGKKEGEGKEEAKKEEPKKEEGGKKETEEGGKKVEEPKKEGELMKKIENEMVLGTAALPYRPVQYRQYYPPPPPMSAYYPVHHSIEENPNACVIC